MAWSQIRSVPMKGTPISPEFFDRDAQAVACDLIGKVLSHRVEGLWLQAMIVETEAYYEAEKASHASLGFTEKRRALFMPPGTIYMYYARGGDSFNVSCAGAGNAVLVKAGIPHGLGNPREDPREDGEGRSRRIGEERPPRPSTSGISATGNSATGTSAQGEEGWNPPPAKDGEMIALMKRLNPGSPGKPRNEARLCSGQTLLCRSLGLRVPDWNGKRIGSASLLLLDVDYRPNRLVRTKRLGIPAGRDDHLPYRFVDYDHAAQATRNPLARGREAGRDYALLPLPPRHETADWKALAPLLHPE